MYVCILRAVVQPTLDPYTEAFFIAGPVALTQEGRGLIMCANVCGTQFDPL